VGDTSAPLAFERQVRVGFARGAGSAGSRVLVGNGVVGGLQYFGVQMRRKVARRWGRRGS
jgi:hypothetical protein